MQFPMEKKDISKLEQIIFLKRKVFELPSFKGFFLIYPQNHYAEKIVQPSNKICFFE